MRVMLPASNAVSHGYKRILIIAYATDIIVLEVSFFSYIGADKLWGSFGIGNKLRNISIHVICNTMSSVKAKAPPAFHTLDQITHPSFMARDRNVLRQNGALDQSSQPSFVF